MNVLDPSTRPYLIRALYEWCGDQGFTPYMVALVDDKVDVPLEYVKEGQIVLNVSASAVEGLKLGNDWVQFRARFGGVAREIFVPVDHVVAIYARENGEGMAFPAPADLTSSEDAAGAKSADGPTGERKIQLVPARGDEAGGSEPPQPPKPGSGRRKRTSLKRIK